MIIRKPYTFLIKHFKKIHIVLLALALFVYYKNLQVYTFVKDFISLLVYNSYEDPISRYIGIGSIVSLIILIVGSAALVSILQKKNKPWKLYLLPVIQYATMLFSYIYISHFFNMYTGVESATSLRAFRDILLVSQFLQFGVFIVFLMRIFGVDTNKFNFKLDEEYLELDQNDKEELEININIDKDGFKRAYKRFIRNLNYVYQEHKFIFRVVVLVFILFTAFNTISYLNSHKSYKQGDSFKANNYIVTINNSYYSDKAYNGKVVSKKSSFVIVDLTIKNNVSAKREVDLNKYHIINGVSNYTPTEKTFETEFQDLGKVYEKVTLKANESKRMIMIFKVDNKLPVDRFVLYYQELNGNNSFLRKIKLKLNDVSKINDQEKQTLGNSFTFKVNNEEETVLFENLEIVQATEYMYRACNNTLCNNNKASYTAPAGYKIFKLTFGSDTYEGNDMAYFAKHYGQIQYLAPNGKPKTIEIANPIQRRYYGKYLYIRVPDEVAVSNDVNLLFTIRDLRYTYKIK